MLFFQTIPRSFVAAYCFQFSLVKSKANSNLQKRKWYDGKIFISIFYRQFIINLYLYSSVILPTILRLVYKKWASSSLPFNQFCFFLNPKFSLFNLKTEISSLLLKSKNGSDWSWPIDPPCRRWRFWIWYQNPDDLAILSEAFPAVSADIGYISLIRLSF